MKKEQLIILLTVMAVAISCEPGNTGKNVIETYRLAGTWRLIEYADNDTANGK